MNTFLFTMPGNEALGNSLLQLLHAQPGEAIIRHSSNGETYIKVLTDMTGSEAVIICTLHQPDEKSLQLYFLAISLKECGASSVTLVAPYLAYMNKDKMFTDDQGISSVFFAEFLSRFIDILITLDLHPSSKISLDEIYSIHTSVLHLGPLVSKWINENVKRPLIIVPDKKSEQWVSKIAEDANAPFIFLEKLFKDYHNAKIAVSQVEKFKKHTPILLDNIISTAHNLIETTGHLKKAGMKKPVCIGIHAAFVENAYANLLMSGSASVITCNTIAHATNGINITELLANEISKNIFVV